MIKKTVYLAGPDVFYPDSNTRRDTLFQLCKDNDFIGIYPGDYEIDPPMAKTIREANIEMIRNSDCLLANLSPFRGFEPDSGTVFEVGFAMALGKSVVAYSNDTRPMIERIRDIQSLSDEHIIDKDGLRVENFGLPNNLMFGHIVVASTPDEAIHRLKNISKSDNR